MIIRSKVLLAIGGAALIAAAGVALAQVESPVLAQARSAGLVGEQIDGYLGFVRTPSADVKAAVDAVNIKRRAIYTDIAAKQNATVQEVAAARGCEQLATRVKPGEAFNTGASWQVRGTGPIALPPVCG